MKLLTPRRVLEKTNTSLLFCLLLIIKSSEPNSKRKLQLLSETHFQLSLELYNEVAKSRKDTNNILISAHNVNVALALLFLGTTANSTSSKELRNLIKSFRIDVINIFWLFLLERELFIEFVASERHSITRIYPTWISINLTDKF